MPNGGGGSGGGEGYGSSGGGNVIQCLPLYSILLAMGNPTINYFRQMELLALVSTNHSKPQAQTTLERGKSSKRSCHS